jgi:5'-deoxynucleotidase YfbR-like HD superfamily hydrolase
VEGYKERPEAGVCLEDIRGLITDGYLPFMKIERVIPLVYEGRRENDAEHSWLVGWSAGILAARYGLDASRATALGTWHDYHERISGDTDLIDDEGWATKESREAEAIIAIKAEFSDNQWVQDLIDEYESKSSQEAKLVWTLDKIQAILMIMQACSDNYWRQKGVTFEDHHRRHIERRNSPYVFQPLVPVYDEVLAELERDRAIYFD